jgi:hypothetical protein
MQTLAMTWNQPLRLNIVAGSPASYFASCVSGSATPPCNGGAAVFDPGRAGPFQVVLPSELGLAGPGFTLDIDALGRPKNGAALIAANATFTITGAACRAPPWSPRSPASSRRNERLHSRRAHHRHRRGGDRRGGDRIGLCLHGALAGAQLGFAARLPDRAGMRRARRGPRAQARVVCRRGPRRAQLHDLQYAAAITPGFTRTVDVVNVAGAGALFCAAGWACKRVRITVQRGSALVRLNLMLINY